MYKTPSNSTINSLHSPKSPSNKSPTKNPRRGDKPAETKLTVKSGFLYATTSKVAGFRPLLHAQKKINKLEEELKDWAKYSDDVAKEREFYLKKLKTIRKLCDNYDELDDTPALDKIRTMLKEAAAMESKEQSASRYQ